jgi:hypothetical protein
MNNEDEQARENLVQQRQQVELRQDAMLTRAEAELHQSDPSALEALSRAAATRQRQQDEHLHGTMLERTEEEVV